MEELSRISGVDIDNDSLIVFDEVQMCYPALTSMKYFLQDAPEYHVVCACSLLGPTEKELSGMADDDATYSFPVGKVTFLRMRPMCFGEFIMARIGRGTFDYLESLDPHGSIPEDLLRTLDTAYLEYLLVGGMPEAVERWCTTHDITEVRRIQRDIISSYRNDMGKYSIESYARLTAVWEAAAHQVAESGDRFRMREAGGYSRTLAGPIQWLLDADLLLRAWEVNTAEVPANPRGGIYFKLYLPDVGLLTCQANVGYDTLASGGDESSGIRGAIAENFVLNELRYALDIDGDSYWWANGSGTSEVDFQLTVGREPVPVVVRSGKLGRIRSLEFYCSKYAPKAAFVVCRRESRIGGEGEYTMVPMYMVWRFGDFAEAAGLRIWPAEVPPLPEWSPPS